MTVWLVPDNPNTLFDPGRNAGAFVHSGSWGGGSFHAYSSMERSIDSYIYEDEDFIFFSSAGNGADKGGEIDKINSITNPASAKNIIAGES